jgi:hypothetical protein
MKPKCPTRECEGTELKSYILRYFQEGVAVDVDNNYFWCRGCNKSYIYEEETKLRPFITCYYRDVGPVVYDGNNFHLWCSNCTKRDISDEEKDELQSLIIKEFYQDGRVTDVDDGNYYFWCNKCHKDYVYDEEKAEFYLDRFYK